MSSLYILGISALSDVWSDVWFPNIVSHFVDYLFTFLIVSFEIHNFLILMSPIIFFLCCLCFWCLIYGNPWPNLRSQRFTLVFYSENFIVLAVTFRSLVDFELIFLYMAWDRQPSHFTSPPAVNKNFSFSTSLPKLTIIFLIVFDLPFANDQCCWAFFHVPIGHLCICFGEKSIQVLWPFFQLHC